MKNSSTFYLANTSISKKTSTTGHIYVELDHSRLDLHAITGKNLNYILSFKNLCSLDLSHNYLKIVPPEFFQLTTMETLNLSNNSIKDVNNVAWIQLKMLTTVDLSFNEIDATLAAASLLNCGSLKCLNLNNNRLKKIPSEIKALKSGIKEIYLRNNHIEELPDDFYQLTSLKILDLGHNQIKLISTKISHCNQLVKLDLSYNLIGELPKEMIYLYQLDVLNVDYNPVLNPPLKICALGMMHIFQYLGKSIIPVSSSKVLPKHATNIGQLTTTSSKINKKIHKYGIIQDVKDFDGTLFEKFQYWRRENNNNQRDSTKQIYESHMKLCQAVTKAINDIIGEHYNPENIIDILLDGSIANKYICGAISSKAKSTIVDCLDGTQNEVYVTLITKRWSNFLTGSLKLLDKTCPFANDDIIAMAKNPLNHIDIILEVIKLIHSL